MVDSWLALIIHIDGSWLAPILQIPGSWLASILQIAQTWLASIIQRAESWLAPILQIAVLTDRWELDYVLMEIAAGFGLYWDQCSTRGNLGQCSAVQCSTVQCSAIQCSAVQCSAVQCSAVQCSAVHLIAPVLHFRRILCPVQYCFLLCQPQAEPITS